MADGSIQPIGNVAYEALSRLVGEFSWLSDRALNSIAQGGASGYIKPSLAAALVEARQVTSQPISSSGLVFGYSPAL